MRSGLPGLCLPDRKRLRLREQDRFPASGERAREQGHPCQCPDAKRGGRAKHSAAARGPQRERSPLRSGDGRQRGSADRIQAAAGREGSSQRLPAAAGRLEAGVSPGRRADDSSTWRRAREPDRDRGLRPLQRPQRQAVSIPNGKAPGTRALSRSNRRPRTGPRRPSGGLHPGQALPAPPPPSLLGSLLPGHAQHGQPARIPRPGHGLEERCGEALHDHSPAVDDSKRVRGPLERLHDRTGGPCRAL